MFGSANRRRPEDAARPSPRRVRRTRRRLDGARRLDLRPRSKNAPVDDPGRRAQACGSRLLGLLGPGRPGGGLRGRRLGGGGLGGGCLRRAPWSRSWPGPCRRRRLRGRLRCRPSSAGRLGAGLGRSLGLCGRRVSAAAGAGAASERAVFDSAARALPAAVWAPFALTALPAAIRALAALRAAALPVLLATRPPATTWVPSIAALTLITRRDLRRAAAFGWIAPALAARSSAEMASLSEVATSALSGCVAATETALATSVFAADRRGCRIACRRSAWRTRFSPDGVRAPCHFRGVLAKVADLRSVSTGCDRRAGAWTARGATANGSRGVRERPALCPCSVARSLLTVRNLSVADHAPARDRSAPAPSRSGVHPASHRGSR